LLLLLLLLLLRAGVPKVIGHLPAAVLHQPDPCSNNAPGLAAVLDSALPPWDSGRLYVGEFLQAAAGSYSKSLQAATASSASS
jgi:hypothetical protein